MRAIDADVLLKEIKAEVVIYGLVERIINRQPTISPDSLVKRGRWEITHDYDNDYEAMRPLGGVVKCSECGYPENGVKSNYCPHCGAFMREAALAASGKEVDLEGRL